MIGIKNIQLKRWRFNLKFRWKRARQRRLSKIRSLRTSKSVKIRALSIPQEKPMSEVKVIASIEKTLEVDGVRQIDVITTEGATLTLKEVEAPDAAKDVYKYDSKDWQEV